MASEEVDRFVSRRQSLGEGHTEAWKRTLEEAQMLADDRREDGWEATYVMAAHTDTVSTDMNDHDRFGLMHVLPNNFADRFTEAYDSDAFSEYLVYGTSVDGVMFVVIELIDPEGHRAILVPCSYDMTMAQGMSESAAEAGVLPSYFKTIDGEILARFDHEEIEPLVTPPNA
ncbi:hypothetical protein J2751_001729 [Halorubrum alkaliphilum]|uniref:Uncharacterized protein n=1 Tax=Halorubrum alkaliphilum TaxID=261290 RepID=A0A8T4GI77_9EURY|nr:hypothetical protein [Halorubrum alkaliphilum]MBP1922715.1 hypothetical protein [Halorubrum alkaliphilum]